jgi:SAM-dependent methyltransferase
MTLPRRSSGYASGLTARAATVTDDLMTDACEPGTAQPVAAYYDRLADVYGTGAYFAARRAAVMHCVADELRAARRVLDLGCGNGAFLSDLAHAAGGPVVGMDLSGRMVAAAHRRAAGTAAIVRGDALALPFRARAFDFVFMSHVLLVVGDLAACLRAVTGVLDRGGVLVATVGACGWPALLRELLGGDGIMELEAIFGGIRPSGRRDEPAAVDSACALAGLRPAWRTARFVVSGEALEEWIHVRWLSIADAAVRERAERILAALRPRLAGQTAEATETLLIARR